MRQITIQIPFDADKLDAIRQFASPDKPSVEVEILALIEKIYTKTVPEPVRRFIDYRAPEPDAQPTTRRKDRSVAYAKVRSGDTGDTIHDCDGGSQEPPRGEGFSSGTVSEV